MYPLKVLKNTMVSFTKTLSLVTYVTKPILLVKINKKKIFLLKLFVYLHW